MAHFRDDEARSIILGAYGRVRSEGAGADNVEIRQGLIEELPLADASVDVVVSNGVLNLSR